MIWALKLLLPVLMRRSSHVLHDILGMGYPLARQVIKRGRRGLYFPLSRFSSPTSTSTILGTLRIWGGSEILLWLSKNNNIVHFCYLIKNMTTILADSGFLSCHSCRFELTNKWYLLYCLVHLLRYRCRTIKLFLLCREWEGDSNATHAKQTHALKTFVVTHFKT